MAQLPARRPFTPSKLWQAPGTRPPLPRRMHGWRGCVPASSHSGGGGEERKGEAEAAKLLQVFQQQQQQCIGSEYGEVRLLSPRAVSATSRLQLRLEG